MTTKTFSADKRGVVRVTDYAGGQFRTYRLMSEAYLLHLLGGGVEPHAKAAADNEVLRDIQRDR